MSAAEMSADLAALARLERTVDLLKAATRAIEVAGVAVRPLADAVFLLASVVDWSASSLRAFPERRVPRVARIEFAELVGRRLEGEPLGYILGNEGFFSLLFLVDQSVLVPRPETELLVEAALERCARLNGPAVLDVGTGSGAIALAVKHSRRDVRMTGLDVSAEAIRCAEVNDMFVSGTIFGSTRWLVSNWFEAVAGERFDLILSNPPYVRSADIEGSLLYEPRLALDGGADGLDAYRALFGSAAAYLADDGALLVEHGADQRGDLVALATGQGWRVAAAREDLAGRPRILELERGPAP